MTCLFATMLSLFVLTYWWLTQRQVVSEAKLKQIEEIDRAIASLSNGGLFIYQPSFKRYLFRQDVQFAKGSFQIPKVDQAQLLEAGKQLQSLMNGLSSKHFANVKYVMVIEGTASNDGFSQNFELSYERALALHHLWEQEGIVIDSDICEVVISGSGTVGLGRFGRDAEVKNQRFFIHIVPKIGGEFWPDFVSNQKPDPKPYTKVESQSPEPLPPALLQLAKPETIVAKQPTQPVRQETGHSIHRKHPSRHSRKHVGASG
jgi:hypothetical protein